MKTINQLLDEIHRLHLSEITEEIGIIRQKLTDSKKQLGAKGGLMLVTNTDEICRKIQACKKTNTAEFVPQAEVV